MEIYEETQFGPAMAMRLAEMQGQLGLMETQRDEANRRAGTLSRDYHNQRAQFRSIAIDRHKQGFYCREGLNDALAELDLDPYIPRYRVDLSACITVEVEADDEDDAVRLARESITIKGDDDVLYIDTGDYELQGVEEVEE